MSACVIEFQQQAAPRLCRMRSTKRAMLLLALSCCLFSLLVTTYGAPSAPEWVRNRGEAMDALIKDRWLTDHLRSSERCASGCWYFITTVAHWSWESLLAIEAATNIEQEYLQWHVRFPSSLPSVSFAFLDIHRFPQLFVDLHINQVPSFSLMWMYDMKPDGSLSWKELKLPYNAALHWHETRPGYYWDILQSLVQLFLHNRHDDLVQTGGHRPQHRLHGAVNDHQFVKFESLEGLDFYRRSFVEPLLVVSAHRHAVIEFSSSLSSHQQHLKLHRRGVLSASNSTLALEFIGQRHDCLHSPRQSHGATDDSGVLRLVVDAVVADSHESSVSVKSADQSDVDFAILFGIDQCWRWSNEMHSITDNGAATTTTTNNNESYDEWLREALQDVEVLAFRSDNILDLIPAGISAIIGFTNTFDPDHELLLETLAGLSRFVHAQNLQERLKIGVLDSVLYSDFDNALRWPPKNETDRLAESSLLPRHQGENFKILELETRYRASSSSSASTSSSSFSAESPSGGFRSSPIAPHRYLFVNPAANLVETFVTRDISTLQQWLVSFPLVLHPELHLQVMEANPCAGLAVHLGAPSEAFTQLLDANKQRLIFVWVEQRACGFDQSFLPVWQAVEERNRIADLHILFLRVPLLDGPIRSDLNVIRTPHLFVLIGPKCRRVQYIGEYTEEAIQSFIESVLIVE